MCYAKYFSFGREISRGRFAEVAPAKALRISIIAAYYNDLQHSKLHIDNMALRFSHQNFSFL